MQTKVIPLERLPGQPFGARAEFRHLGARRQAPVEGQVESLHGDNLAPGKLHTYAAIRCKLSKLAGTMFLRSISTENVCSI